MKGQPPNQGISECPKELVRKLKKARVGSKGKRMGGLFGCWVYRTQKKAAQRAKASEAKAEQAERRGGAIK